MPEKYRNFKQIVNIFYNEEIDGIAEEEALKKPGNIRIEPQIYYDKFVGDMKIEFKIGNKKMYKIKNLAEFYTKMINKEFHRYGEKLQFIHREEAFEDESKPLLSFIMKYAEIIKYANSNSNSNYKYYGKALSETSIIIGNTAIDDLFDVLKNRKVSFQKDYKQEIIEFSEEEPKIEFKLKKIDEEYAIIPNIEIYNVTIINGKNYKYILNNQKLYRCTKEFENTTLKLLELFRKNYITEAKLGKNELTQVFSVIMPKVKDAIIVEGISDEELEKYKPKDLITKVFLDFDKNNYLIADIKFCYGNKEFNPLDEKQKLDFPRNIIKETKVLNTFRKTGFMIDVKNLRFILPNDDKIYEFITQDISYYMQQFDVLVTDDFKKKQIIKRPKMGEIGVRVLNDLLTIDLKDLNIDPTELKSIMEKYSLKKKYHRLKDGSYINLQENEEVGFLDKFITGLDIEYKELEEGKIRLPISRSLYLNKLLKSIKGTEIIKNEEYKKVVNKLDKEQLEENLEIPNKLKNTLRYYQKTGYKWLKTLDSYRFGGILADDMGLRKNNSNFICNCRLCK